MMQPHIALEQEPFTPTQCIAICDTAAIDALWRRSDQYLPAGCEAADGKLARAREYIASCERLQVPSIFIDDHNDGGVYIRFAQGRHRFSAMREAGCETVPIGMTFATRRVAMMHGLVAG